MSVAKSEEMSMNLQQWIKQQWQDLLRSAPGRRFQDRYHRLRQRRLSATRRLVSLGLGAAAVLAGLVMLFIPGPGILTMAVGLGLLAEQSLAAARVLDWLELKARQAAKWLTRPRRHSA